MNLLANHSRSISNPHPARSPCFPAKLWESSSGRQMGCTWSLQSTDELSWMMAMSLMYFESLNQQNSNSICSKQTTLWTQKLGMCK